MNTDLFKICKASPEEDFEQFKVLLCFCITAPDADLYLPMEYFTAQSKIRTLHPYADFAEKLRGVRDEIFAVRRSIEACTDLNGFKSFVGVAYEHIKQQGVDLTYILACVPEEDKWIGKADLSGNVQGCMQFSMMELASLEQVFKTLALMYSETE